MRQRSERRDRARERERKTDRAEVAAAQDAAPLDSRVTVSDTGKVGEEVF